MTTVVADSTVLIYLTRLDSLTLADDLFAQVLVPAVVYEEVVERGQAEGYRDALAVEGATNDYLTVTALSDVLTQEAETLRETATLGRGETAAIVLARQHDARCLTDDHAARTTAESLGVDVGGTIFVLLEALAADLFTYETYVSHIDDLSDSGFYMGAALYRRAIDAGEEIAHK